MSEMVGLGQGRGSPQGLSMLTFPRMKTKKRAQVRFGVGQRDTMENKRAATLELVPSLLKLKNILVPIDFSKASLKALAYAIPFAEQFGAQISLIHVAEPYLYPTDPDLMPLVLDRRSVTSLQAKLRKVGSRLVGHPRLGSCIVKVGKAFHEVTETARAMDVDLIILTTHGHTGLKHIVLGSTAERVIRHAPCPVLTVREKERDFV